MILISIDNLIEGMIVAKPVYRANGTILLNDGMKIKNKYIDKLRELKIDYIYIKEGSSDIIVIDDVIKDDTKKKSIEVVKHMFDSISSTNEVKMDLIKRQVNDIIDELIQNDNVIISLANIRAVDDYTFGHSVNVCVLSMITGLSMGYSRSELYNLGLGAILHDIGKTKVPNEILKKPTPLSIGEFEEIKKHTIIGYELMSQKKDIPKSITDAILYHHERFDGKGYPYRLKGADIPEYARIVSVVDVYDALTSDRVYKKRVRVHEAIEYFISLSGHQFDYDIVKHFINNIALYPIGKGVILSTGEKGYIIEVKKAFPTRPKVRIVYDRTNRELSSPYDIDLAMHNSISITDTTEEIMTKFKCTYRNLLI